MTATLTLLVVAGIIAQTTTLMVLGLWTARQRHAQIRHRVGIVAFLALTFLPMGWLFANRWTIWTISPLPVARPAANLQTNHTNHSTPASPAPAATLPSSTVAPNNSRGKTVAISWPLVFAGIWSLGAGVQGVRWIRGLGAVRRLQ